MGDGEGLNGPGHSTAVLLVVVVLVVIFLAVVVSGLVSVIV